MEFFRVLSLLPVVLAREPLLAVVYAVFPVLLFMPLCSSHCLRAMTLPRKCLHGIKDAAQAFVRCLSSKAEGYTALTLKSVGVPAEQMARTQINSVLNLAAKILELDGVSVIIKAVTLLFSFLPGVTLASLNKIRSKDPHLIGAGLTTVCLAAELFETDSV